MDFEQLMAEEDLETMADSIIEDAENEGLAGQEEFEQADLIMSGEENGMDAEPENLNETEEVVVEDISKLYDGFTSEDHVRMYLKDIGRIVKQKRGPPRQEGKT